MSFQAYIDNIKAKTGKTLDDFKKIAEKKGLLKPGVKAGEIVAAGHPQIADRARADGV